MRRRNGCLTVLEAGLVGWAAGGASMFAVAVCSPTVFVQPPVVTASWTVAPISGDWNADGKPDLAGIGYNGITVLPGDGLGGFGPPVTTAGQSGYGLAAGHFDAGATLDLALYQYPNVAVFPGNGDGTFGAPINTGFSDFYLMHFVPADLDGDGKVDLLAFGDNDSRLVRLLGKGDGTFQPLVIASLSGGVQGVAVADLDGDGRQDLAVAQSDGYVSILLGKPGGFGSPTPFVVDGGASSIAVADVDLDGVPDLVLTVPGFVAALRGFGDGSFEAALLFDGGPNPYSVVVGDFNEDGIPDAAVLTGGAVEVLAGNGMGGFRPPAGFVADQNPAGLIAGNFDGDAHLDLATTALVYPSSRTWILRGEGDGRFMDSFRLDNVGTVTGEGDFNGDGRPDLLMIDASTYPPSMRVLEGVGDGTFREGPATIIRNISNGRPAIGDFDGDLRSDVAFLTYDNEIDVYLSRGDGTFSAPAATNSGFAGSATSVAVADWTKDGHTDLAIAGANNFGATSYFIAVLPGKGDGTFQDGIATTLSFAPAQLIPANMDGDGNLDVVGAGRTVVQNTTSPLAVFFGVGDGTFVEGATLVPQSTAGAVGDFNEDGIPDIVAATANQSQVLLFAGNGDRTFRDPAHIGLSGSPIDLTAADFDGDHHIDVASVNTYPGGVNLLVGLGNGHFHAPESYRTSGYGGEFLVGDFLAGGNLEMLVGGVDLFRNSRLSVAPETSTPVLACTGSALDIDAPASGFGPLSYQWKKDGSPLADDSRIHGSQTRHLHIDALVDTDDGSYVASVSDSCTATSGGGEIVDATSKLSAPALDVAASVPASTAGLTAAALSDRSHRYAWTVTGGTITSGQGSNAITFTSGLPGTFVRIQVVESLAGDCASSDPSLAKTLADYADVPPSHPYHHAIVTVAQEGITSGCGGGKYCPDGAVTRDQMSVFILRGEHGGDYQPPSATGLVFSDVSTGTPFAKWMEQFGHEGISTGCGSGAPPPFCPGSVVTRDAMATFLLRGKLGASYQPPPATGLVFGDVHTDTFLAKWMEDLKAKGISSGCGGGNYCPSSVVSRGEMAVLVTRTFLSP